jgi:hypothetical protein
MISGEKFLIISMLVVKEYGIMKTTLCMMAILLALSCAVPAFASCSLDNGKLTGSACSVKDIQNLEKEKMQEKVIFKGEKNLRPVRINPEIKNPEESQCIFCLQKALFEK